MFTKTGIYLPCYVNHIYPQLYWVYSQKQLDLSTTMKKALAGYGSNCKLNIDHE